MEAFSSKILFDSSSLDQLNPCPSTTIYDSNYINKSSILDQPNNIMMEYSSSLVTHDYKLVTPIINNTKYSSKHKHPSSPYSAQSTKVGSSFFILFFIFYFQEFSN